MKWRGIKGGGATQSTGVLEDTCSTFPSEVEPALAPGMALVRTPRYSVSSPFGHGRAPR